MLSGGAFRALGGFLGFQPHHVEKKAERVEAVAAHQACELAGDARHIGSRLLRVAQSTSETAR